MDDLNWYELRDPSDIPSPALLVYPERVKENIDTMLEIAGDPDHLRPHIKTHKSAEIIRLQMARGISKFKCATLNEAELLADCGARDILLAYQPLGPNIGRLIHLIKSYPQLEFSALADNSDTLGMISEEAKKASVSVSLYLDLNVGMNRTGIVPGSEAIGLYRFMCQDPGLIAAGLHAYDGHIRHTDFAQRKEACDLAFEKVLWLKRELETQGLPVPNIISGGSPTFPVHAQRKGVEASPGTTLLWDARYGELFPEMRFLHAAVLLTRVLSKPAPGILCLDLGHKSVAPEMNFPRVKIFGMEKLEQVSQSEEHLVLSTYGESTDYAVGDPCYALPMHICPTVAKYPEMHLIEKGEFTGKWKVDARDH